MSTGVIALAILLCLVVLLLVLMALLLRDLYRGLGPSYFYMKGQYARCRELAAKPFWWKVFPSVRNSSIYMQGACLHLEGRLEESLEVLGSISIDKIDANLRYAVQSVIAGNLVLLDREPEQALACMDSAGGTMTSPSDDLLRAHIMLSLGDEQAAQECLERAKAETMSRLALGTKTVLMQDRKLEQVMAEYLSGWFLVRVNRAAEAAPHLEAAVNMSLENVFRWRAKELLERLKGNESTPL